MRNIPVTQQAVQLVGPSHIKFTSEKPVIPPGDYQILGQVQAVGLCFSDLKLIKQFSRHPRKLRIKEGMDLSTLQDMPNYAPNDQATVPGHEVVITVVKVGPKVKGYKAGQKYLVQPDYRWIKTNDSNALLGYNFEGGLQEYLLLDTRVTISPDGESSLVPVKKNMSDSSVALVEPWSCVEQAYDTKEKRTIIPHGRMLVVADKNPAYKAFKKLFKKFGYPGEITWISELTPPKEIKAKTFKSLGNIKDEVFDDIIYFGSSARKAENLFEFLNNGGLLNFVLCGDKFDSDVNIPIGRTHYGNIRITGTVTDQPVQAMEQIPYSGKIKEGDKINIVGAAGPMGKMNVLRNLCLKVANTTVFASDKDPERLEKLSQTVLPIANIYGAGYRPFNPEREKIGIPFTYSVIMVPKGELVAKTVKDSAQNAIINIFANLPESERAAIDLNRYIRKNMYFISTSGSTIKSMKKVLKKVSKKKLSSNVSVAAICDLESAPEAIRSVEKQSIAGKIVVYPRCRNMGLLKLEDIPRKLPELARYLENGNWTRQAEEKLHQIFALSNVGVES